MGFLTLLRKLKKSDQEARLLVLGLDNSGKTTILKKLSDADISQIMPTQGFIIKSLVHDGFKLNVWDVGGQTAIHPCWRNYYYQTDALIYVIDSADRNRKEETRVELQQLLDEKKLTNVPLLIMTNKQDLGNALSPDEICAELGLNEMRERTWQILPCSARTGDGLQEGFQWVVEQISPRAPPSAARGRPIVTKVSDPADLHAHRQRQLQSEVPAAIAEWRHQLLLPARRAHLQGNHAATSAPRHGPAAHCISTTDMAAMAVHFNMHVSQNLPGEVAEFYWKQMMRGTDGLRLDFCVPEEAPHCPHVINTLKNCGANVDTYYHAANESSLLAISAVWASVVGEPYPPLLRATLNSLHERFHGQIESFAELHASLGDFDIQIPISGAFNGWTADIEEEFLLQQV